MSLAGREGVGAGLWYMVCGWRWLNVDEAEAYGRPLEGMEEERLLEVSSRLGWLKGVRGW